MMPSRGVLPVALILLSCAGAPEPGSEITISSLDFGVVSYRGDYSGDLRVTNVGTKPATLRRIEQRSGGPGVFVTTRDVDLEPGESTVWRARLEMREEPIRQVELAAVFDDSTTLFTVRARRGEPCEPVNVDLGDVRLTSSASTTFEVHNPLDVPTELDLGTVSAPFSLEPSGKARLAAGERRSVTLTFTPFQAGDAEVPWVFASRTDCLASRSTLHGRGVTRALVFTPGRLSGFGVISPPSVKDVPVELRNESRSPIRIIEAHTTERPDAPVTASLATALPLDVPGGSSVRLMVRLWPRSTTPTTEESFSELVLTTDSELAPTVSLPVVFHRTKPCVSATRTLLAFPSLENFCRSTGEPVVFTNECPHAVTLTDVRVPDDFAILRGSRAPTLAPGARVPFDFAFAPKTAGDRSATLVVESDVLDGTERLELTLSGAATPERVVEDVFSEPKVKLDVLFVIDDGPQMLPLAANTATELRFYARQVEALDTRIGFITTSTAPGEVGRLRPTGSGEWLVNPGPADLSALGSITGQQTGASSCLEAVNAALAEPTSGVRRMLRPSTGLQLICVTNRADEGVQALSTVLGQLEAQLPRWTNIAVVAQFGTAPQCGGSVDDGTFDRWINFSRIWSYDADVCSRWANWISPLPTHWGPPTSFRLSEVPDLTRLPMRVTVNGADRLQGRDWEWRPEQNMVNFHVLSAPWFGEELRVRYLPYCAR
jgi:hypothetical protein